MVAGRSPYEGSLMKFDIFLSICQTEVDGETPSERQMLLNFFDQVKLADELGFGTAWVAETHLSCQVQKENPGAVIPHFKGEIGLNTDILQVAHLVFSQTKRINVGSAIRNIICNGGPIAHAEAIRTFLSLNSVSPFGKNRKLEIGFAAGRFPFSNSPYGFYPKTDLEKSAWDVIKNKYFQEATEIFVRLLAGEKISSKEISTRALAAKDFREPKDWQRVQQAAGVTGDEIKLDHHWNFEKIGVIPFEAPLENLRLTIGSHDPDAQVLANQFLPVGVFNLSITPTDVIESTHDRMKKCYHPAGKGWRRELMPRTVLLFIDENRDKAKAQAQKAWENYWRAMERTLDPQKVASAVENTMAGTPEDIQKMIAAKYHPDDRLMLWFDFNNHNNEAVKQAMKLFSGTFFKTSASTAEIRQDF
jgi:alkanesulfonate monooxygenase SsuD/methylene tetrahydromethanopterin reductase-like flavin-dependent oxidoreductase (luciferase family)